MCFSVRHSPKRDFFKTFSSTSIFELATYSELSRQCECAVYSGWTGLTCVALHSPILLSVLFLAAHGSVFGTCFVLAKNIQLGPRCSNWGAGNILEACDAGVCRKGCRGTIVVLRPFATDVMRWCVEDYHPKGVTITKCCKSQRRSIILKKRCCSLYVRKIR